MEIFDYISPNVYHNSFDKRKHLTNSGGILFLLITFMGLGFSTYFGLDLIFRSNPKSSFFIQKYENDVGIVNLDVLGIFHYIYIYDMVNSRLIESNPRIFQVEALMYSIDKSLNVTYSYDNCNKLSNYEELPKNLLGIGFNYSVCLFTQYVNKTSKTIFDKDFEPPKLKYGVNRGDGSPTIYSVYVKKCKNSTYNNNHCLPEKEIDDYMNYKGLIMEFSDNFFDITNYTHPITTYGYRISEIISKEYFIRNSINLQRVKIITNNGIIFDDREEIISFCFEKNEKPAIKKEKENEKSIISEISFYLQNNVRIYERSYTRLQDVLANIGGFMKMLSMISSIINIPFFPFRLLENTLFVINNYLKDFNEVNHMLKKNDSQLSKENMIHKFEPVLKSINLENINKNNSNKKIDLSKNKPNIISFIKSYFICSKNQLHDELTKFRNHILNEATIYELYFSNIIIEKRLLQLSNKFNISNDNIKLNYQDIKMKYDRVKET